MTTIDDYIDKDEYAEPINLQIPMICRNHNDYSATRNNRAYCTIPENYDKQVYNCTYCSDEKDLHGYRCMNLEKQI